MLKASLEFYIISTEIAQLLQTNTLTHKHKWAKPPSKYFLFLFLLPLPQHHPPKHTHNLFWVPSLNSLTLTHSTTRSKNTTYLPTHTHPSSLQKCVSSQIRHRGATVASATAFKFKFAIIIIAACWLPTRDIIIKESEINETEICSHIHAHRVFVFAHSWQHCLRVIIFLISCAKFKVVSVFFSMHQQQGLLGWRTARFSISWWCERVPCWQRQLRWRRLATLHLRRGVTHTNTARFWTLPSDTIARRWLMITHTYTHSRKMTMMTRCPTTCKVLFFVVIFGRKWIEKSIWQLVFLFGEHLRVFREI